MTARLVIRVGLGLLTTPGLLFSVSNAQTSRPAATSRPASTPAVNAPAGAGAKPGLTVSPDAPIGPPGQADTRALDVVNAMANALGGPQALGNTGALRFTFEVSVNDTIRSSRALWWDRRANRCRIEGKNREGKNSVTIFNPETREGKTWIDGKLMAGEEAGKLLEQGYARFINDTYWLLMPHKLFDPGVHLAMDGEAEVHGSMCDRVKVTFDHVGLTPGDTYWAYIDRATHLMTRWGFILQGDREKDKDATESLFDWTGWETFGNLKLATAKSKVDDPGKLAILFRNIEATESFPEKTFTDPGMMAH